MSAPDVNVPPLDAPCRCGHARRDHNGHTEDEAPTGAQASFGGSACELCWTCGTFVLELE
jgi:hypothetical protein